MEISVFNLSQLVFLNETGTVCKPNIYLNVTLFQKATACTFLPVGFFKVKQIARKYGIDIVFGEQPLSVVIIDIYAGLLIILQFPRAPFQAAELLLTGC